MSAEPSGFLQSLIDPRLVNPTTGLVTVTHSFTTSGTSAVLRLA